MSMPLLRCREAVPYLSAYVDGELDSRLREQVEVHLASCTKCSGEVARYRALDSLLDSLPASSPSPDVFDRVLASASSQNKEKAVRQSLLQPERLLAPRSLPAFFVTDTNLAAPILPIRPRGQKRRSWILSTALPTLAALLIITMTFVFFHVRTHDVHVVVTPVPTANIEQVTNKQVFNLSSQLSFIPALPSYYPPGAAFPKAKVGTFYDGTKYLDVVWALPPPFTNLHLREVGGSLAERAQYDYVETVNAPPRVWQILRLQPWQNMSDLNGNAGRLIEGTTYGNFSITLDIGVIGGNSNSLTSPNSQSSNLAKELTALRLTSLSIETRYLPLESVSAPDSREVVHFQIHTVGQSDGLPYTWDVYWSSPHALTRAALEDSSGALLYTDYFNGAQVTRCIAHSACEALSSAPAGDPASEGNEVQNFLSDNINPIIADGELWNLGAEPAPPSLGIGTELVYQLAVVDGPYPITVYVSQDGTQVVGVISQIDQAAPGGPYATSPLVSTAQSLGICSGGVSYPLIAYLPSNSPEIPPLTAPVRPAPGSRFHIPSIATCPQS